MPWISLLSTRASSLQKNGSPQERALSLWNTSHTVTVVTRESFYPAIILDRDPKIAQSMSDPGTTYRTRDEVQKMRSTQDPIRGLQKYIEDWGLATEEELKTIDKESKASVDKAVEEAKASPEPDMNDFWTDIYYKGTEPPFMRGREREEVSPVWPLPPSFLRTVANDEFPRSATFRHH